jgi:exopolysaccharide biosynthesis polyprenyl glycosylphosphotransferase
MGQIANIIDFEGMRRTKAARIPLPPVQVGNSDLARLVPGISNTSPDEAQPRSLLCAIAVEILPRFCRRFEAKMLAPAMLDSALIILVCAFEILMFGARTIHPGILCVYLLAFLIFAIEEDLYTTKKTAWEENVAACRAVAWAMLFASLSLSWSATRGFRSETIALGLGTLIALISVRVVCRKLCPANSHIQNVLIVGSGVKAKQISDAIYHNPDSLRLVKGYMAENHFRNVYGAAMLTRITREEFIDEIIIASADPKIMEVVIEESCRNQLDVKIAPEICIAPSAAHCGFENLGGIPLLKIRNHRPPVYSLAVKRSLDVVLALCGGIALSPLLLLIAAFIKSDSAGPVFYRAQRTGRKGRHFACYKLRTMVPEADSLKDELRERNERDGAFFKIENDPRVTRIGRLLRRYSLDELPQLWNVLLGDMSLVGPRPHPPDDVSQYKIQHLQRLDFVPGITGLWQVTARRDPSFERSVALDVEYIKHWNLWLDLRILCKTVFAVLEGSGA